MQKQVGDLFVIEQIEVEAAPPNVEPPGPERPTVPVHDSTQAMGVPHHVARPEVVVREHLRFIVDPLPAGPDN
jgi:hypothetical protein